MQNISYKKGIQNISNPKQCINKQSVYTEFRMRSSRTRYSGFSSSLKFMIDIAPLFVLPFMPKRVDSYILTNLFNHIAISVISCEQYCVLMLRFTIFACCHLLCENPFNSQCLRLTERENNTIPNFKKEQCSYCLRQQCAHNITSFL